MSRDSSPPDDYQALSNLSIALQHYKQVVSERLIEQSQIGQIIKDAEAGAAKAERGIADVLARLNIGGAE